MAHFPVALKVAYLGQVGPNTHGPERLFGSVLFWSVPR